MFTVRLDELINLKIPLKTEAQIEEVIDNLNKATQNAAWQATPDSNETHINVNYPKSIKEKIAEKRKLRQQWRRTRSEEDKRNFNKSIRDLKKLIFNMKNHSIQEYLQSLSPTETTDYSLWRATKKLKLKLKLTSQYLR